MGRASSDSSRSSGGRAGDAEAAPDNVVDMSAVRTGGHARRPVDPALVESALPVVLERCTLTHTERHRASEAMVAAEWGQRVPDFVAALLEIDESRSAAIAAEAFREAGDPQKVVELLFRPAAQAIGEGWRTDSTDFLEVTIATGRMQRLFRHMTREHPPHVAADPARRLLLAPAPGDQHAFGLSVVEDAFFRAGWDVDRCECDEVGEMFRLVGANAYLVVGISISVARLLPEISALVRTLRAKSRNPSVVLMAGGGIVAERAQEAIDCGFDLTAPDAARAVALAQASAESRANRDAPSMAAE